MQVVLYARVSSEAQAEKDLSIPAQLKVLRDYAKRNNWEIYKEFVDEGISARTALGRPAFQEMISQVKQKEKKFEKILVWKLNRFARNREDSIIYKNLIRKFGVEVFSVTEQIDNTPSGQLLEGILEVIDEFYSTNLAQDTLRGMKENAQRGFLNGGKAPIGYRKMKVLDGKNERNKLEPDPIFAPIVRRIFKDYRDGMGARQIATTLNLEGVKTDLGKRWSNSTIFRILKDESYTGTLVFNKTYNSYGKRRKKSEEEIIKIKNNHKAIIDKKIFEKVQRIREERDPKIYHPRMIKSEYLLSGLIVCGKCRRKMIGAAGKSSQYFYYRCQTANKEGKLSCDAKLVNREEIEKHVIDQILVNILSEENIKQLVELTNKELRKSKGRYKEQITECQKRLSDKQTRLHNLYEALETKTMEMEYLAPRIKEVKDEIIDLEKKKNEAEYKMQNSEIKLINYNTVKGYVDDLKTLLKNDSVTVEERRELIRSFVKEIIVEDNKVSIEYYIPVGAKKKVLLSKAG